MAIMLRAEKTNANYDDFKVLLVGIICALGLLTMVPMVRQGYDLFVTHRPFVVAETLRLVPEKDSPVPSILYDADAFVSVDSTWIATVETGNEAQGPLAMVVGRAAYSVKAEDDTKLWTWQSWFDNGMGSKVPAVPYKPFMVCVRYVSKAKGTEVTDESPKYCSKLYDPILQREVHE